MRTRFNTSFFLRSLYFPVKWASPPRAYIVWRERTKCKLTMSYLSFSGGPCSTENNLRPIFWGGSESYTKPRSTPRLYFEAGGSEGPQHSLGSKKDHFLENTSLCGGDTDHIRTRPFYPFSFHDSVNSHIYVMLTTGSVAFKM